MNKCILISILNMVEEQPQPKVPESKFLLYDAGLCNI